MQTSEVTSVNAEGSVPMPLAGGPHQAEAGLSDAKSDALEREQGGEGFGPI